MKKKTNTSSIVLLASCLLAGFDLCALIANVHINHPIATIIRCFYFIVISFFTYCLIADDANRTKREIRAHRILVRQQSEIDFRNAYEAFKKEMHR